MEQGSAEPGPGPYTMDGLCNLYLPVILLMRSGDIETNPGPNTPESTVSEEEYLELSERISPSNYKRVGIRLGISFTVLSHMKKQSDDYSDHFMNVFMKWRDRQPPGTNTRAVLAEKLQTCHLGELSGLLLDGSLVQSRTSEPSAQPITSQPHQPLSPELVQRCSEDFKFKYRTTLCKIRADPLNPDSLMQFEDIYTNLVLEEEEKHGRKKQKLDYSGLWNLKDNGKFPRRLLVQGEAGAGKTTLCAKIAWDWISGKHLQDILWLIVVPLREAQKYTIGEIAKSYLTSNNPTTASQLTEYMHLNPDKVFILFDGLDEFSGRVVQDRENGSQSRGQESHSDQSAKASGQSSPQEIEIREILRSQKLETCPVMVTTRPWKAREIRWNGSLRKQYTFLYVEGFSKKNVAEYMRKYFADEEDKAETLIQFANDNDVISENMAPYPIYIAMLCLMWREFDEEKREMMKSLQTFSQIFKEMFVFLKEHYALKLTKESCSLDESLNDRLKEINTLLVPITSLAFDGLLNNTLVFKEGDFEHCPGSMETACRVGVLSEENSIISRKGRHCAGNLRKQSTVFFPHKLFQEYMAGIHLASLYETDKGEYNRLIKKVTGQRKEEFRYLLYFTASQNQTIGINVLTHIERSMQGYNDCHFLVDVAFECHDTDAASLVKDKVSLLNSTLTISRKMTAHTVAGYTFIQPDMVRLRVEKECGPTMAHDVAEMICSIPSLKEVSLHRELHINFFTTLAAQGQFSQVKSFKILADKVLNSAPALHDLAAALCSMPNLTELTVTGWILSDDEFRSKLKAKVSSMKLKSLEISGDLIPVSVAALHDLVALCSMPHLTELTVPGWILSDEFCSTLKAKALSMKFKSLEISGDSIPDSVPALHDLVAALCSMPHLTELTVTGWILSVEFCSTLKAKALSMKLKSIHITGRKVPVSVPALPYLAAALCSMPHLTELTVPGWILSVEFCATLKTWALSTKNCFPQISKGNFTFNGTPLENLESFICMFPVPPSISRPRWLDTCVSVLRRSRNIPSVNPLAQSSEPCDRPVIVRNLGGVYQTYREEHGSTSGHSGYSTSHPRGLDTSVSILRRSRNIPSVSPLAQSSEPCDRPDIVRNLGGIYQTYREEHGSTLGHSGYSTSHPRGLDTSVSVMKGSHSFPSLSPLVQSSVPYDQPSTSRDPDDVYQTYHEEHGSMSRDSECSISHPMSIFDSLSELTFSLPDQIPDTSMSNVQQLPLTVRNKSGRSKSIKRTAPCTQSRVPKDVPEKRPRVGTPEESPPAQQCDYSSSDESSTS